MVEFSVEKQHFLLVVVELKKKKKNTQEANIQLCECIQILWKAAKLGRLCENLLDQGGTESHTSNRSSI